MGNSCCLYSEELYGIKEVSTALTDKMFKSEKISSAIKDSGEEVTQGKKDYIDNKTKWGIEIISRQATAISREDMKKIFDQMGERP